MPVLHLDGIAKAHGERTLFAGVRWAVPGDARAGLVGPNGCGKSTFLEILAGRAPPDAGRVVRPRGVRVGYLPQEVDRRGRGTVLEETLEGAAEVRAIEARLDALSTEIEATADEGARDALVHEQARLHERMEALGAFDLEARARRILAGLGFGPQDLDRPLTALSGGWVMRVHLARLLLEAPDLLLLDEPTNHLDLPSLTWLEGFLESYSGAWIVISHDRTFLERRVRSILHLTPDGLVVVRGGYARYQAVMAQRREQAEREAARRQRKIQEMRRFVERFGAKASKARQAQSRKKTVARLEAELADLAPAPAPEAHPLSFSFPPAPRSGREVLRLRGARKAYGDTVVYDGLDFLLCRGDRVALVGPNGAGKSTLLSLLAGTLPLDAGERVVGYRVRLFAYAQHQAEALPATQRVFDHLASLMPEANETTVRSMLGAFLFRGDDVDKPIGVLSGGEKARLALASALARAPNCLLLDEPTSHLDLAGREALEAALQTYEGALVCISHDRTFIARVCNEVVEVLPGGRVTRSPGTYDDLLRRRAAAGEEEASDARSTRDEDPAMAARAEAKARRIAEREARRRAEREALRAERERARRIADAQARIEATEARMAHLDALLCDPEIHKDPKRLKEVARERESLEATLGELYAAWEALEA